MQGRRGLVRAVAGLAAAVAVSVVVQGSVAGVSYAGSSNSDRVQNPANGHWYQKIGRPMTWHSAVSYCRTRRGHLVTIGDAQEDAFVFGTFGPGAWLGATQEGSHEWRWITGEPWSYTNWEPGEPSTNPPGDYLNYTPRTPGTWDNVADGSGWTVCEWETPYVALGDSYSSGEGSPPFDPAAGRCDQSVTGWAGLISLGTSDAHLPPVRLVACSGARMADLPGQIAALRSILNAATSSGSVTRPRPLVSVTIGGNDLGFSAVLVACALGDCTRYVDKKRWQATLRRPGSLFGRLVAAYTSIRAAAPRADLVVVGYPNIFPADRAAVVPTACGWLSNSERRALVKLAKALDETVRLAAGRAGATFVSTLDSLAGHELCTGTRAWLNPVTLSPLDTLQGHPDGRGQRAMAAAIEPVLNRLS